MSGVLQILVGGGGGNPSTAHVMGVGYYLFYYDEFDYNQYYGFAAYCFDGDLTKTADGRFFPSSRLTVPVYQVSYSIDTFGNSNFVVDFLWTSTTNLISVAAIDGTDYLMSDAGLVYAGLSTVTLTLATPGVVNATAHGFSANEPIMFQTTGALPTGLSANTIYFTRIVTANTFTVSSTVGGAEIAFSGTQSGTHTAYRQPRRSFTCSNPPGSVPPSWCIVPRAVTGSGTTTTFSTGTSHLWQNGDGVTFTTSGTLPTGLTVDTKYFVVNRTSTTFQVATTAGGAATGSGTGSGTIVAYRAVDVVFR